MSEDQKSGTQVQETMSQDKLSFVLKTFRAMLDVSGTGLTGLTTKNIAASESALVSSAREIEILNDRFTIREGEKKVKFATKLAEDKITTIYVTDDAGNFVKVSEEDSTKKLCAFRIDDLNTEYLEALKELKEKVSVKLYKYPNTKINALFKEGKFDKVDLSVLDGLVFDIEVPA